MAPTPHRMTGVALITGAASGIGRATAHTFVSEGCTRLIISDVNASGLKVVAEELKNLDADVQTCVVIANVAVEEDVNRMVEEGVKAFGAIHYAVNNAGVSSKPRVRTDQLEVKSFDDVMAVNLRGVWLCERAELRQMLKQEKTLTMRTGAPAQRGAIVNISSIFGRISHSNVGGYAAAKTGVLGISRTDAVAYGKDGIRVNSVCPGSIKTPLVEFQIKNGVYPEDMYKSVPLFRWGMPEEIAQAVVFLTSEKASFITGEELVVDGGSIIASH